MSNQQNNNKFNTSRDRSFYAISNTEGNTTKDTFIKNGSNIIMKDYSNYAPQSNSSNIGGNDGLNPFVIDSKIKDLESKLITLEQANKILVERINTHEKNFIVQLKQLEVNNQEERENRYKTQKTMNIISEQNNANSNDLNMRINMLQERIIKGDENKSQQRQFDLESQKYLIGKLTEKITKTVKSEVEARYKADMDGKIFSQKLNNKFETSLDILKKEMEEIANQTRAEIQNISRECSERTHNVSKYIDQQIQEAAFGKGSANEDLKNFVRKLTEQVKNGLLSISDKHAMIESRLNKLEEKDDVNKHDYHNEMTKFEERFMKRINDIKVFVELNMSKHDQYLEYNMRKITENIEKNIQVLAGQLIETRIKVNERFEKIFEEHHDQYKKIVEDMEEICNNLYKCQDILQKQDKKYQDIHHQINVSLANIYSREDVQIVQERIIKTIECNFLQEQINNIHNALQTCNVEFNQNISELNKGSSNNYEFITKQLKEQEKRMVEIAEKNLSMYDEMQKSSDAIEVKQIVNEMVAKVDSSYISVLIQQSKDEESNINEKIKENNEKIMNSINEIQNNKQNISMLDDKVKKIQSSLDASGQNMSGMEEQMQKMREEAKELEMKESVNKVMDSIITYVENSITKEKMDKMSQFDFSQMRNKLIDLSDKYDSLSNTNTEINSIKENIKVLNEQQELLMNKPKGGDDIKMATIQMLNNVEFDNIYSILNSGNIGGGGHSGLNEDNYNEIVDNKINKAMEKIKRDNEEMWVKCVQMKDKVTDPEEIKKLLNDVRPAVLSKGESYKELLEVNSYDEQNYTPKVNMNIRNNNIDYGNNSNGQQDAGPDINSKKSSKKSSKKKANTSNNNNQAIVNNNNENNVNNANINEENKSKTSNKSKKSGAQAINDENKSKGTNNSKNAGLQNNDENKSKGTNKSKNPSIQNNEESKSRGTNKSKNPSIQNNDENKSKGTNKSKSNSQKESQEIKSNNEKKSKTSKNSKVSPKNEGQNDGPNQESNENKENNLDSGGNQEENQEDEDEEEEEDDEEGLEESGQELPGEMKSKNEVSGKTKPKK